jgi:predicted  nucleic acid-binding Zn-ribbon protein
VAVDLTALSEVQKLDSEIVRRERALAELDDGSAAAARLEELRAQTQDAETAFRALEKELVDRELEMKGLEAKQKEITDKLYGGRVRNPKELGDMQSEVDMLKRNIDELTDKIVPMMDEIEQQRAALEGTRSQVAAAEAELAAIRERFQATGDRLRGEIAELGQQRKQAAAAVEAALLRRYEDVRRHRGDPALVPVEGNVCPACHIGIPSDTIRALERGTSVQTCESCGRIFHWTKPAAAVEETAAEDEEP